MSFFISFIIEIKNNNYIIGVIKIKVVSKMVCSLLIRVNNKLKYYIILIPVIITILDFNSYKINK